MAIFAHKAGSKEVAGLLSNVVVDTPPLEGYLLVWSEKVQSFVVSPPPDSANFVNTTKTYGGANAITVNGGIKKNVLNFKQIKAGSGIALHQTDTDIVINSTLSIDNLSVPGSYRIIIDNDNTSSNDKFEIWTALSSPGSPISINITPPITPQTIHYLFSGNENNKGFFRTINGFDLQSAGFAAGQFIVVQGAGNQDGSWVIDSVTKIGNETTIFITEPFTGTHGFNLGGPKETVHISTVDLIVPEPSGSLPNPYNTNLPYILKSFSKDFSSSGLNFSAGNIITISGTKDEMIDGTYTISDIIPKGPGPFDYSMLIFSPTTPLPVSSFILDSNPLNPQITISMQTVEAPTGFYVKKDGTVRANEVFVSNTPSSSESVTSKSYVENNFSKFIESYFMAFF